MLYFTIQNRLQDGTSIGLRSGGCEMTILSSDVFGLSSDYPRIVFLLAEAFREYPLKSSASRFRDRGSIW